MPTPSQTQAVLEPGVGKLRTEADLQRFLRDELRSHGLIQAESLKGQIRPDQIAAAAAGDGLTGGGGAPLAVSVDGITIEIASDALRRRVIGSRLERAADQTAIATATYTKITWGAGDVIFDTDSLFDDTNDRLIIPQTGLWTVGAGVGWAANATGYRGFSIKVNNSFVKGLNPAVPTTPTDFPRVTFSSQVTLTVNDILELWVFQTSGGNLDTRAAGGDVYLFATYEGVI